MAEVDTSAVRGRRGGGATYTITIRMSREEHERLLIASETMQASHRDVLATLIDGALATAIQIMRHG